MKIINIMGRGRSGSTVVGRILSYYSRGKIIYAGEMRLLPIVYNKFCGCGKKFKFCHYWGNFNNIYNRYLGEDLIHNKFLLIGLFLPNFLFLKFYQKKISNLKKFINIISKFKFDILIDISKNPLFTRLLIFATDDIDIYYVYRNPYAVFYSWVRNKQYKKKTVFKFNKKKKFFIILEWLVSNFLSVIVYLRHKKLIKPVSYDPIYSGYDVSDLINDLKKSKTDKKNNQMW